MKLAIIVKFQIFVYLGGVYGSDEHEWLVEWYILKIIKCGGLFDQNGEEEVYYFWKVTKNSLLFIVYYNCQSTTFS